MREHADEKSPFGLIDTVGNAGDWVDHPGGGTGFMGSEYSSNPQDCTVYSFMGLPGEMADTLAAGRYWLVTCRGVTPAGKQ